MPADRHCDIVVYACIRSAPSKETSSSDVLINEGSNALERNDLTEARANS